MSLGVIKYLSGDNNKVGDVIPVDFVSDYVILCSGMMANSNELSIFQCCTSSKNPNTIRNFNENAERYWKAYPNPQRIMDINVTVIANKKYLRF